MTHSAIEHYKNFRDQDALRVLDDEEDKRDDHFDDDEDEEEVDDEI